MSWIYWYPLLACIDLTVLLVNSLCNEYYGSLLMSFQVAPINRLVYQVLSAEMQELCYMLGKHKNSMFLTQRITRVHVCFVLFSFFVCVQLLSASKVTLRLTVVRRWLCQMFLFWWEGRMKKQLSVQIRGKKGENLRFYFL